MSAGDARERLLAEPTSQSQGCCSFVRRWTQWRDGGTDRACWKLLCSVTLVAEMVYYLHVVRRRVSDEQQFAALCFVAVTFSLKALVETWGQDTPTWICPGTVVVFFMIYALIIRGIIYSDGICTQNPDILFDCRNVLGLALYIFGSSYSLSYEVGRFAWKARPENRGKLHTIGLASLCIHPNYFGDLFIYTGWGLVTGTSCSLGVPAAMVASFVFIVIPNSDSYLASRYESEWPAYAEKTAILLPGVRSAAANKVLGIACLLVSFWLSAACAGQCG